MLTTVLAMLLLPLSLTPLVAALAASGVVDIQIDLGAFFIRVTLLIAVPFALAWLLRLGMGAARLRHYDERLGGLNVVLMVVFAVAVMDGVTARLLSEPTAVGQLLLAACVAALLLHAGGFFIFRRYGRDTALGAAICSGNRNMGLMLAVTAGSAGPAFSIYVGLAQIPMYFAPLLLGWVLRLPSDFKK